MAASASLTARFTAEQPGLDLQPIGTAEQLISLVQGQHSILWVSTTGTVSDITVRGWPVDDGEVELGGGLTITRPDGGEAGVIEFDEKPMTVAFDIEP
jgi:hypothetical protein